MRYPSLLRSGSEHLCLLWGSPDILVLYAIFSLCFWQCFQVPVPECMYFPFSSVASAPRAVDVLPQFCMLSNEIYKDSYGVTNRSGSRSPVCTSQVISLLQSSLAWQLFISVELLMNWIPLASPFSCQNGDLKDQVSLHPGIYSGNEILIWSCTLLPGDDPPPHPIKHPLVQHTGW